MKKTKFSLEKAKKAVLISSQIEGQKIRNEVPGKSGEKVTRKSK